MRDYAESSWPHELGVGPEFRTILMLSALLNTYVAEKGTAHF